MSNQSDRKKQRRKRRKRAGDWPPPHRTGVTPIPTEQRSLCFLFRGGMSLAFHHRSPPEPVRALTLVPPKTLVELERALASVRRPPTRDAPRAAREAAPIVLGPPTAEA